ncbi:MAG: riboflavin-specific deaminase [Candidatus Latescibacteria bacterium]|jgi:pyrimidine deaminase RibD-like protein|nr:riboflavin-specific deaminase [Candidatus Latescibacterota bacterium]MBT4139064.1 riboflavin-specific deaminase [Candidatus Latescibacterota bacterium]
MNYSAEQINYFMHEALIEGRKALPACRPNPPVGCVLVRADRMIARGYTNSPGEHHAEAMALAQVDGDLEDVTAFVTLEPCSFLGRTPSCAKTLVDRKIGQVYVALIDPHPKNQGQGIAILKSAGADVTVGILKDEAEKDLNPYLIKES